MKQRVKLLGVGAAGLMLAGIASYGASASTAPTQPTGTDATGGGSSAPACDHVDDVKFELQWVIQGQFAGYVAARDNGLFEKYCLNVELIPAGTDITPQQQVADGNVDFAIAWVPKALATREAGANIVDIAQIFQRSGTLQVSFVDKGITSVEDFKGKNIGNWGGGNEFEIFAALSQAGLDPASDVTLVQQGFDMSGLLDGSIDAAEAMTYNEYAQVLEAENPDTGELYQPDELNVVSYQDVGVGMLQDSIWADGGRLADDPAYADIATRLLAASIEGWAWVRDNPQDAADLVVAAGSQLGASHQLWQINEVNKLIWPAPDGIGMINEDAWNQTVDIALNTKNLEGGTVLTAQPTEGAYTNDIITAALALVGSGVDTTGADFTPIEVTLNAGGN